MNFIQKFFQNIRKGWGQGGDTFTVFNQSGRRSVTQEKLLEEYKNNVYNCITAIADEVGQYQPILKRGADSDDTRIKQHPLLDLLNNPSDNLTTFELWEATISYKKLTGNSFWYFPKGQMTNNLKQIKVLRPDKVEIAIDDDTGEILGYALQKKHGVKQPLEIDEVYHFKTFNPYNPYRGLGAVEAALLHVDIDTHTSEFQNNFLQNQAVPSGVLTLKGNISKAAWKKVKRKWREQQAGLKNVGKTLFVRESEATFTKIGLAISDVEMDKLSDLSEKRVRKIFRVPKIILGDLDVSGLGRANAEVADYVFASKVVDPELRRFDSDIKRMLKKFYNESSIYVTHESKIPRDSEKAANINKAAVDIWITKNEARADSNLPPKEGGDDLYIPFNLTPIGSASPPPQESDSENKNVKVIRIKTKTVKKKRQKNK